MPVPDRRAIVIAFAVVVAGTLLSGCREDVSSRSFAEKTTGGSAGLLPAPPTDGEIEFSSYEPENPHQELAPGLLRQIVFEQAADRALTADAADAGLDVSAHNLLVGPGKSTEETGLPGGAIFEVRAGSGTVTIGQETQDLTTGSTFAVSEGESFRLENSSDIGLALRVYLIRLRQ